MTTSKIKQPKQAAGKLPSRGEGGLYKKSSKVTVNENGNSSLKQKGTGKPQLLSDDDDDSDDENGSNFKEKLSTVAPPAIRVNEEYAAKYHDRKLKEDFSKNVMSRSIFMDSDDDDEDLSTDDDVAEELTDQVDEQINETIRMIRQKDPRIYDPKFQPFKGIAAGGNDDFETEAKPKKKKEKELRYKDMIIRRAVEGLADESSDEDGVGAEGNVQYQPSSYLEDQERAKQEFKRALAQKEEDDEEEFGLEAKPSATPLPPPPSSKSKSKSVKQQTADDDFLWKYVNDKAWLKDDADSFSAPSSNISSLAKNPLIPQTLQMLKEDEEELDKAEDFEQQFQFRYQDPNATRIVTHARSIEGSLRRKDESSRAKQRDSKADRKEQDRKAKIAELRRLKELKREMLEQELKKAFEKGGKGALVTFKPEDLDEDFDPATWDAKMAQAFGDDYYNEEDDELKTKDEEDGSEDMDNEEANEQEDAEAGEGVTVEKEDDVNEELDERNFELIRKIAREKADEDVGDENELAITEGKFRYKKVQPNDFGLDDAEIWAATNAELNAFVSLKRMSSYADREWHASAKHRARFRQLLKRRQQELDDKKHSKKKAHASAGTSATAKRYKQSDTKGSSAAAAAAAPSGMSEARLKSYGR